MRIGRVIRVTGAVLPIAIRLALVSNGVALADASVVVTDGGYQPQVVTIHAGESLTFLNTGSKPHTVTAADGAFDSGVIAPGGRWSVTLTELGSFVISSPADGFRGEVIVQAIDVTNPPLLTARPSLLPGGSHPLAPSSDVSPTAILAIVAVVGVLVGVALGYSRRRALSPPRRKG